MLYTEYTKKAMRICFEAHEDQDDKGGLPYVFHPFHLANQMETEAETCAALLHDVIEDTPITHADLAKEGFPPEVMDALLYLTHDEGIPYLQYVERLSGNRIAAKVKLADLRHNSMPGRLNVIDGEARDRMRKYLRAQAILTGGKEDLNRMTLSLRYEIPVIEYPGKNTAAFSYSTRMEDLQPQQGRQPQQTPEPQQDLYSQQDLHSPQASGPQQGRQPQQDLQSPQPAVLTAVLTPDGRVRRYNVVLPTGENEDFYELYPLLNYLEQNGYSAAHAVSCL